VRAVVERLRQAALDLPLAHVGEIIEMADPHGLDYEKYRGVDGDLMWLLIQSGKSEVVCHDTPPGTKTHYSHPPTHMVAFTVEVGDGCEYANVGLCQYKAGGSWSWSSFCKTQYATDPECGGVANFLRCHMALVAFLDKAKATPGLAVNVRDEGDYWTNRDPEALAREVGEWNEMIAAVAGQFKDALAGTSTSLAAPILEYPDFEHLEAAGAARRADATA